MDDKFLYGFHADPPAEFADRLRTRLKHHEQTARIKGSRRLTWRAGAAAAAAILAGVC